MSTLTSVSILVMLVPTDLVVTCCTAERMSAVCSRDVVLVATCTGELGTLADTGNVMEDGGLSQIGEASITELSSMNFKSCVSIPFTTS